MDIEVLCYMKNQHSLVNLPIILHHLKKTKRHKIEGRTLEETSAKILFFSLSYSVFLFVSVYLI